MGKVHRFPTQVKNSHQSLVGEFPGEIVKQSRIADSARKTSATLQNLLDSNLGSHKNWVKTKKCSILFQATSHLPILSDFATIFF